MTVRAQVRAPIYVRERSGRRRFTFAPKFRMKVSYFAKRGSSEAIHWAAVFARIWRKALCLCGIRRVEGLAGILAIASFEMDSLAVSHSRAESKLATLSHAFRGSSRDIYTWTCPLFCFRIVTGGVNRYRQTMASAAAWQSEGAVLVRLATI
jgi:hypothetical protein